MQRLPVIVAQGGINPAGRTSMFHSYRRLIFDKLSAATQKQTVESIAGLISNSGKSTKDLLSNTLIRKINTTNLFDPEKIYSHKIVKLNKGSTLNICEPLDDTFNKKWQIDKDHTGNLNLTALENQGVILANSYNLSVQGAGLLPSGFNPESFYPARNHPRTLSMTICAVSDAIKSSGFTIKQLKSLVSAEEIGVYAGAAMCSLDHLGFGGMLQARLRGKKVNAKQCPLGFAEMPADFINAYVLGSIGKTGCNLGACASLLYNMEHAIADIQSNKIRIAIVGNSEAPVTPEVIEGYAAMKALTTEKSLRKLDNLTEDQAINWNTACRPFGNNAGFVIAESAQYFILMDDQLAIESGAEILAAVAGVFINADGNKKSISSPGAGNYFTVAKATALLRAIVGDNALQNQTFIQAHGTGTPQNRVTESQIFSTVAQAFSIPNWHISAVKNYLGHSIGAAAGDQIMATLGIWKDGIIPGITNTKELATDVVTSNLKFLLEHTEIDASNMKASLINAKGFGGNNATAAILSPYFTEQLLTARYGKQAMHTWNSLKTKLHDKQLQYDAECLRGDFQPIYNFDQEVLNPEDIDVTSKKITVAKTDLQIPLDIDNPY